MNKLSGLIDRLEELASSTTCRKLFSAIETSGDAARNAQLHQDSTIELLLRYAGEAFGYGKDVTSTGR
jgi:hypothetical protein